MEAAGTEVAAGMEEGGMAAVGVEAGTEAVGMEGVGGPDMAAAGGVVIILIGAGAAVTGAAVTRGAGAAVTGVSRNRFLSSRTLSALKIWDEAERPINYPEGLAGKAGEFIIGNDLRVTRLGFGSMRITGNGIWGEPADRAGAIRVLRRAVELGINFIDTADSYGPKNRRLVSFL
jgi:Aldo/keto reductase family